MALTANERYELADVADIARGIAWGCWRFRWYACAAAWVVAIAGTFLVLRMPDVHRASARVYVDTQSTLRPLLQGLAVNTDVMSDVSLMEMAVMSRPNLERLARETDLDIEAKDPAAFEAMINRLQASIELRKEGASIIGITYEDNDPRQALAVVTGLLNSFIEGSLGENRSDASAAQRFLLQKLKEYAARLNEAEANLAEFKRKNVGQMPGDGLDYYSRMQDAQARLEAIEASLRIARNRRAELLRQIEGEEPVFGLVGEGAKPGGPTGSQDGRIAQLEAELAELRLKYTDTHPDIVQIKRTIEALQAERSATRLPAVTSSRAYSPLDLNPVYQKMKIELSATEVEVVQLQSEYSDQAAIVSGLRRRVDTIPAIEAELKRLTRDYDVTKNQYDELLQRVESARLSEDAEQSKDDVTFRVFDPPTVPALPIGPNRPLLLTGVLVLAFAAAIGVALALNVTQPVFYLGSELQRRFAIQVIGTVRIARTGAEQAVERKSGYLVVGGLGGIVVAYLIVLAFWNATTGGTVGGLPGGG
ncbi:MAG: chain length-determining protein [Gammaproteobacteria bacterium]|nr:chain length-determining protein [Gammaproteobacteria bacterium]